MLYEIRIRSHVSSVVRRTVTPSTVQHRAGNPVLVTAPFRHVLRRSVPRTMINNPWSALPPNAPFLLPCDRPFVDSFNRSASERTLVRTELLPEPFFGPYDAPIVLLLLNPGFHPDDAAVHSNAHFARQLRSSLASVPRITASYRRRDWSRTSMVGSGRSTARLVTSRRAIARGFSRSNSSRITRPHSPMRTFDFPLSASPLRSFRRRWNEALRSLSGAATTFDRRHSRARVLPEAFSHEESSPHVDVTRKPGRPTSV